MKQKLILLMLMAYSIIPTMAQVGSSGVPIDPGFPVTPIDPVKIISKNDALEAAKKEFQGKTVDYYVLDDIMAFGWRIFVDAEPLKGWEHDGYILDFPATIKGSEELMPSSKTHVRIPPEGNYVPLEINTQYNSNSLSKPMVRKRSISPSEQAEADRTYALIISGGICPQSNKERYWNDCSFIYQTLVNNYGIPKGNIYPIMSDGDNPAEDMLGIDNKYRSQCLDLDGDGSDDISLAATKANISATLKSLESKINKDDQLFIFVIDHGGTDDYKLGCSVPCSHF